ncbi:DUF3576 domain-containing protein [Candidatus Pelagibacter ubique]|nr:DUF3576 domain-containing protein [Candidatus Pelagibacter ubique]
MVFLKKFQVLFVLFLSITFLNSCSGLPKGGDGSLTDPKDRVKKNLEEGRGFRLMDVNKNSKGGGVFEFASSNELWRASLDTIDFMPLASVNYSGGIIITDWYSTDQNSNESIKISIRFLTNEVRADAINIKVFNKICLAQSNCVISEKEGNLIPELKRKILRTAAIYEKQKKEKEKKK